MAKITVNNHAYRADLLVFDKDGLMFDSEQFWIEMANARMRSISKHVSLDSLIDWTIIEGFCSNTDVTMGNVRYARSDEADGKWQFLFYDLDAAFRFTGSIYYNLMTQYSVQHIQISSAIVPLMQNAEFKDRFLRRANELLSGPLTNEAVLAEIDRLAAEVEPEIARDRARTGRDKRSWERSVQELRELIRENNWRQKNIEALCEVFELTKAERAKYFSEIDGK